jgi:hypothetical protein
VGFTAILSMPKIRREGLPRALFRHLTDRLYNRELSNRDLEAFSEWLEGEPEVPDGAWFKHFGGMIVCGDGELVKTFLRSGQAAFGKEL